MSAPVISVGWTKAENTMESNKHRNSGEKEGQVSQEDLITQNLLSQTPTLVGLVQPLMLAVSHEVTVLITGETGTGKTFLARLIHDFSNRKNERFLVVPCGALAHNLVESELFGHSRGAFTGADRAKEGKFAAAGKGTILLDEIDTLGLEQQAKLLRVLETGEYEPIGSNRTEFCRARIIATSNWNLEEAVQQGKFRQDLYYRLHVMAFFLPPLRERKEDVRPLSQNMLQRFAAKFGKKISGINPDALAILENFPWPGNIRQLENAIQLAVMICDGPDLLRHHLPKPIQEATAALLAKIQTAPGPVEEAVC
ncbi:MAG TPA: sigma 54-interacting transcriptional regulator [Gemmataceae bacterium]|nr:sigma 54-interacting transcriptional regulator [Gemmataceae bacterium]